MVLKIRLLRGGGATGPPAQWSRIACGGASECAVVRRCSQRQQQVYGGRRKEDAAREEEQEPVAVLLSGVVDRVTLLLRLAVSAVAGTPLITLFIGARSQSQP